MYRSPGRPRISAARCPSVQSSTSTIETGTYPRSTGHPRIQRDPMSNRAEPSVRPGPCTDDGFTETAVHAQVGAEREHALLREELRSLVLREERAPVRRFLGADDSLRLADRRGRRRVHDARHARAGGRPDHRSRSVDVREEHPFRVANAHRVHSGDMEHRLASAHPLASRRPRRRCRPATGCRAARPGRRAPPPVSARGRARPVRRRPVAEAARRRRIHSRR